MCVFNLIGEDSYNVGAFACLDLLHVSSVTRSNIICVNYLSHG